MVKVFRILPEHTNKIDKINYNLKNNIPVIGAVYMPGCGHCDNMIPKWKIASNEMKKKYGGNVIIALIHKDSIGSTNLPSGNISGYPHIMGYVNNREIEYNGDRSPEDFIKFMKLHGGSHLMTKQTGGKTEKKTKRKCTKQTTKKYINRSSPPYPANECKNKRKKGNDKSYYDSVKASNGVYRWVKVNKTKKTKKNKKI